MNKIGCTYAIIFPNDKIYIEYVINIKKIFIMEKLK
jgi:hypothetical protein